MDKETSLGHMPNGKWAFDDGVTSVFVDMLERSIPSYNVMRELTFKIGSRFVKKGTDIIDIGSSRGDAISPFIDKFGAYNRYTMIETSKPMINVLNERFKYLQESNIVKVIDCDLRETFPVTKNTSLLLSILTLQFIPIEYRQFVMDKIYSTLIPGGAAIVVEKVLGESYATNDILIDEYLQFKVDNGYSRDDVDRKKMSLQCVLVPLQPSWNENMFSGSGFKHVDCFYKHLNFMGWILIK